MDVQSTNVSAMRAPLAARFRLGAVIPAFVLSLLIALILATGHGKGEAPAIVFFASLVAIPAVVLLNCWVLFVGWRRRSRLIASAAVVPALIGVGSVGLGLLTAVWALGIAGLLLAARRTSQ